jgi:hypothetical protein
LVTVVLAVLLWLLEIATFQLGAFAADLVGGSFTYMGSGDLRSLRVAIDTYAGDITRLLVHLYLWDAAVLMLVALPFTVWFVVWARRGAVGALVKGALLLLALRCSVIAVAALRVPTLFSDSYYQDGTGAGARVMELVCSRGGAIGLGVLWVALIALMVRRVGWRAGAPAVVALAALGGVVVHAETRRPEVALPPGSVVLYFADSLRSDLADADGLPRLWREVEARHATVVPRVAPPVARTAPALVALLTGKLPAESGVTTMFSPSSRFRQTPSLASRYRAKHYCTVAVGEYPAEFMQKIDLGFEVNDTPLVRFREIALQTALTKDPFALATLTFALGRAAVFDDEGNLFAGLPTFADARALQDRFARAVAERCGRRPVFAFLFADQPHFPYVQTWPHYLDLDGDYHGRYKYLKDAVSTPATDADRARIRALYRASARAADDGFAAFIAMLARGGALDASTVIVSGDHGESLYDHLGIMGHGDQIGELEGITVPWIVFGAHREDFAGPSLVESIRMTPLLLDINQIAHDVAPTLPPDWIYVETGEWLADTPNVPHDRVAYPELSELLMVKNRNAQIEIKPEYVRIVEYAKQRLWIIGGDRYVLTPLADRVVWTKNGAPLAAAPAEIMDFMEQHDPATAALLAR